MGVAGSGDWLVEGGTDPADIAQRYDDWAATYDLDLDAWSYDAPAVAARTLLDRRPDVASVLDAGCGTGMVGSALREAGYRGALHGLDISESSLRLAEVTGAYTSLGLADLQQPLPLADAVVDALTCVGVMTYVPDVESAWLDFARVVRPGGHLVVTQREDLWAPRGCDQVVALLERDGVCDTVEVIGPAPYLPGNADGMAEIGVYYVVARVA